MIEQSLKEPDSLKSLKFPVNDSMIIERLFDVGVELKTNATQLLPLQRADFFGNTVYLPAQPLRHLYTLYGPMAQIPDGPFAYIYPRPSVLTFLISAVVVFTSTNAAVMFLLVLASQLLLTGQASCLVLGAALICNFVSMLRIRLSSKLKVFDDPELPLVSPELCVSVTQQDGRYLKVLRQLLNSRLLLVVQFCFSLLALASLFFDSFEMMRATSGKKPPKWNGFDVTKDA